MVMLKIIKQDLQLKGLVNKPRIDYNETFAPVARLDMVRMVLAIVAHNKWYVHQMDVMSIFLNGSLEEEFYAR